jgi:HlyD family secretion protein
MAKRKNNRLLIIILLLIVVVLIVAAGIKAKSKPHGLEVEVEKVELRTLKETVSASGKVFPEKEVKISSDVSGEIVDLYVVEGDSVRAGQILAKIDPEVYISAVERGEASLNNSKSNLSVQQATIQSSKAQVEQIEAQLVNARRINERNKNLLKEEVISDADFEASETDLLQLEANLRSSQASYNSAIKSAEAASFSIQSSEASLKELKTNLQRTTITSPTDGIVSKLNVEQGERVVGTVQFEGTEMMRIANFNSMEVQVEVSENDILRVSLGDSVDIEVDAYLDETFRGIVSEIANSAANTDAGGQVVLTSDQVTNFIVKIRILSDSYDELIDETDNIPFRPGMSAAVDIYTETVRDALSVPIQAVTIRDLGLEGDVEEDDPEYEEDEREVVFVYDADTARMITVKTGIQNNDFIQIKEGLDQDMEIVKGPYSAVSRKIDSGDELRHKEKDKKKKGKKDRSDDE